MAIDLLAFGPHPDDVELGMGGTLARHSSQGHATAIIDLTRGEMGSNGTPAERIAEGEAAARILGCQWRRNLGLPDRNLDHRDPEQLLRVVNAIRAAQPQVVAVNGSVDRHPDHVAAHRLLQEALFSAGLRRYETELPPFRPTKVVYYFINDEQEPSFYVDITPHWQQKSESLFAHRSQFQPAEGGVETRLNGAVGLPYLIESRDRFFGAKVGVPFAEGFIVTGPRLVADLLSF
ncbi:MAG: bacillithiol biosynthesis deacetylase BshB1 [Mycobacterium leprae]